MNTAQAAARRACSIVQAAARPRYPTLANKFLCPLAPARADKLLSSSSPLPPGVR
jgi:hypothetical protein